MSVGSINKNIGSPNWFSHKMSLKGSIYVWGRKHIVLHPQVSFFQVLHTLQ